MNFVWSRRARKELLKIDRDYRQTIIDKLFAIGDAWAPPPDLKKLSNPKDHYRLRVGDYRVIFFMTEEEDEDTCCIVTVKRRTSTTYLHEERATYAYTVHKR